MRICNPPEPTYHFAFLAKALLPLTRFFVFLPAMNRLPLLLALLPTLALAQRPRPADSTRTARDSSETTPTAALPADTIPLGKLAYSLSLEGDFRTGNLQRALYTIRGTAEYVPQRAGLGFYTSPRYSYGKTAGLLQEDELFLDLNATLFYTQHDVYGLAFGVFETSNLRQITDRRYGGAGLGWRITGGRTSPKARVKITVTNALLFERTDFFETSGQPSRDVTVVRNSTRLRVAAAWLDGRLTLANTTFIQPALGHPNLRANAITQALIQLTKRLNFSLTLENSYESLVAEGRKSADTHLTFGLTLRSL